VLGAASLDGIVLRYGSFYGPGTAISKGGSFVEDVHRRRIPLVGNAKGIWSFIHIDDAATATVLAMERGELVFTILSMMSQLPSQNGYRRLPLLLARNRHAGLQGSWQGYWLAAMALR
jgi:nucleoside-diphosphate-sugar epimerase